LRPSGILFDALVAGYVRQNGLRACITVAAVALGVAIALAIDLANATAVASFSRNVNVVSSRVNLQVFGLGKPFDERTLLRVRAVPGVEDAEPATEDTIVVGAKPGDAFSGEVLRVLGVDVLQGVATNAQLPAQPAGSYDPYAFVTGRAAVVSERVARRYGLRQGGSFDALWGGRKIRLRVGAVLPASAAGVDSSVVFVDVVTGQELFGKVGVLDRIDCVVDPARLQAAQREIAALLPHGTRVVEPRVRNGEIERLLRSFRFNLGALSYMALLVAAYLVYNAVAISVVQRRSQIGTLRAIGVRRSQIFATFLAEGAIAGVAGSLVGVLFGSYLATFAVKAVTTTVDTIYVGIHADAVAYDPWALARAFAVGVVLAAASAAYPAFDAARTAPAIVIRSEALERRLAASGAYYALGGAGLALLGMLATRFGPIDGIPLFGYAAALLFVAGASLCIPLCVSLTARAGAAAGLQFFPPARLAVAGLGASPRRTSIAIASLMVATGLVVAIAALLSSFRTSVSDWTAQSLRADLFVRPYGAVGASSESRFPPQVAQTLRRLPGVRAVDGFRLLTVPFGGTQIDLGATDVRSLGLRNKLVLLDGPGIASIARTMPGTNGVLINEPLAVHFGLATGDSIPLDTPSGNVRLKVLAVYNDFSSDAGGMLIDSRTMKRLYGDDSVDSLAIYAAPSADLHDLRSRVVRAMLPLRVDVETTRELRELVIAIFDRTFAITSALRVIAVAIAVLGVVSALFALVLERRREIGVLRYLGLSTGGVRSMVLCEAGLIGTLGGALGIALGLVLAVLLVFVINRQTFGWLIAWNVPVGALVQTFVLVVVAALAAGLYPAGVAARIRTDETVRTE
jgi:putative ABC transport system permease protein